MNVQRWVVVLGVSALSMVVGCGDSSPRKSVAYKSSDEAGSPPAAGAPPRMNVGFRAPQGPPADAAAVGGEAAAKGGKPAEVEQELAIERKIIYSAAIEVTIKDLDTTREEVERLVEEFKGYVAKSEVLGDTGKKRTASWTLKIPSAKFRLAVSGLSKLGVTTKNSSDSQDVTEEFVDVQSRLKNLKAEEEVLNKLLKDAVRLEDVLKLREQIKNIRGDIERAEGRLKYLSTMSALSTINFTAREEEKYIPPTAPAPPPEPTFLQSVENTFSNSWKVLQRTAESIALFFVGLAPWIPVLLIGFFVIRYFFVQLFRGLNRLYESEPAKPKIPKAKPIIDETAAE
jgi:hypothetical protein